MTIARRRPVTAVLVLVIVLAAGGGGTGGCNRDGHSDESSNVPDDRLVMAAHSAVEDAFRQSLLPGFERHWQRTTGRRVAVEASFGPSGAQTRAVIGGLPADLVILALADHVERIAAEDLINHDWRDAPWQGLVSRSRVAIGVRRGNPLAIEGWHDLVREPVRSIHADPRSSGIAMWCMAAVYGAGLTGSPASADSPDSSAASALLLGVERRVMLMEPSSRRALTTFEHGLGDAIIDTEGAILAAAARGSDIEAVIPAMTILVENPMTLVDRNVEEHGSRAAAEALVAYLRGDEAQRLLAAHGFQPVAPTVPAPGDEIGAPSVQVFDIESLGGWATVRDHLFGPGGLWQEVQRQLASEWQ
ncbi:MAG: substrate-binding domain-containing protein [Candidatus Eiseniibacteriota bacterium]|jgi:sulfate transport system substrate-binding protein